MKIYLIGAGPGDPELITLKARRILQGCDAVVYDDLIPGEILGLAPRNAQKIYVGKRSGKEYMKQPQINELLVELGRKGLTVARVKGGDPCIFGRGGEEALYLQEHGIPFEIVPGITSAIAGPVSAGIPPTHRGLAASVTFVTAHEDPTKESGFLDWSLLAREPGTIIFLMGAGRISSIAQKLVKQGMSPDTPCALIQDATTPRQRHIISSLSSVGPEAERHGIGSPCIVVVGQVVHLSKTLYRARDLPLSGMSVLITRPDHLAYETSMLFASKGARAVVYPLIEISALPFDIPELKTYDILIFTSQNAVSLFFERLFAEGKDARELGGLEVFCIGPKTRDALKEYGIAADAMASEFRAEGIVELFKGRNLKGMRVCLPRARGARPVLVEALTQQGATVDEILIYDTIIPKQANPQTFAAALDEVDTAVFTSPSGVRHAVTLLEENTKKLLSKKLVAIGPVTATALEKYGLRAFLTASEYTDEGIIAALTGESP
ncbi:MAG: uroporphyrinogen-III C-methyltransferase [Desulfomonilia bacterium]